MSNAKYNATSLAFPGQDPNGNDHAGLTKREYFAGLAMQGLLAANSKAHTNDPKN